MAQLLRSSDGWDYQTLADRLLDRKANSMHNMRRIVDAARIAYEADLKRLHAEALDNLVFKALTGKTP